MIPKISVITPSYNQADYLEQTILSVINQDYKNLEYIIIDGSSIDQSVEIIKKYDKYIHYWISEVDKGQPHAINKGLVQSSGEIVAFLNSDDLYLPGTLKAVSDYFQVHSDCKWLCGNTIMFGEGVSTELNHAVVPESARQALTWKAHCPQPGMFWRRELLADGFDEALNYCFDHDLYIRLLLKLNKCHYLPLPLAAYRLHKNSKTVADNEKFGEEFDLIAEKYESQLDWRSARLVRAVRHIRKSHKYAKANDLNESLAWFAKSVLASPEIVFHRPFWGTLKQILLP